MSSKRKSFQSFLRVALFGVIGFGLSHPVPAALNKKAGEVVEVIGQKPKLTYKRERKSGHLKVDDDLFFKDNILTDSRTGARLNLKPDASSKIDFFIHESSDLLIDDTLMQAGGRKDVTARFAKGLLKIVTKGFSDKKRFLIHTPNGVVGVRGSILTIEIERDIVGIAVEKGTIDFTPNQFSTAYITEGVMEHTQSIVDQSGKNNNTTHFYNQQGEKVLETKGREVLRQNIKPSQAGTPFKVAVVETAENSGFAPLEDAKKGSVQKVIDVKPVATAAFMQPAQLKVTEEGALSVGNTFVSLEQAIQPQSTPQIGAPCEGYFNPDCK